MNPGNGGSSLKTLNKWIEKEHYSFTNVCITRGKVIPDLSRLCTELRNYDKIVALGNVASNALNKIDLKHFKMPHPSGLNRQLNDKEFINDRRIQLSIYCGWRSPPHTQELRQNRQTI